MKLTLMPIKEIFARQVEARLGEYGPKPQTLECMPGFEFKE